MRHLHTRVSEHLGITPITGKLCKNPPQSSIFSHLISTGHTASINDFEILSSCSDDQELLIHESFLISKMKPSQRSRQFNSSSHILISLFFIFCLYVLSSNLYVFIFVRHFPSLPFLILTFCVPHTLL